jgi:ABC-type branched-subunit amino acid transport system substrate-binding protein
VQKFAPDATDFTAQMLGLRDSNPQAVLIWGIPPAAGLAQKAYKQLALNVPVYQSHGIGNQAFLDTAGDTANGLLAPLGPHARRRPAQGRRPAEGRRHEVHRRLQGQVQRQPRRPSPGTPTTAS